MSFDYERLGKELSLATAAAFRRFAAETQGQTIYTFCLYTSGEANYFVATGNTEEALLVDAKRSETSPETLRWLPCDWRYHPVAEELFEPVQAILDSAWNDEFSEYSVEPAQAFEVALSVLEELAAREGQSGIEFNLLKGDQSEDERLRWGARVNGGRA